MRRGGMQHIPRPAQWTQGKPAPWPIGAKVSAAQLLGSVEAHRPVAVDDTGLRPSAILAVMHDGPSGVEVLLTRRSQHLSNHRGEMSFPGGRVERGESFEDAALREAQEEVGLASSEVRLVGTLDPLATVVSGSYIVPIIAVADRRPAVAPASAEVDTVQWVTFDELMAADTFREEIWTLPFGDRSIFFFELDTETVWGATARILHQLLTLATASR
jgi:8-oxo-dGTP pyrophosphatase MutT (NUDIX family)